MSKLIKMMVPIISLSLILLFSMAIDTSHLAVVEAQSFGNGWQATYYNSTDLSTNPVISIQDTVINFNYGTNAPMVPGVNADNFSVRWTSQENFPTAGTYRFSAGADDGIRVIIDGNTVINDFRQTNAFTVRTSDVNLTAGTHNITVEFVEFTGNAAVQFSWTTAVAGTAAPTAPPTITPLPAIPAGALTGTVIRATRLNVRSAPSLGGAIIGRILRGETYAIVGRNENATWFILRLAGYEGWVSGYYIYVNGNEFNPPIRSATSIYGVPSGFRDTGVLVQTRATMRLRAEPNLSSRQTGRITWGAIIPVGGRTAAGDWYQVLWKGTVGWVYTGYLDIREGDYANIPIIR